jgi:hypothetical protein
VLPPSAPAGPLFGIRLDAGSVLPIALWSLTTALGVLLFAAVVRRPGRTAEAVGIMPGSLSSTRATRVPPGAPAADVDDEDGDSDTAHDGDRPRWLRASLREQRESGSRGLLPVASEPARFASAARAGVERRTIGYRLVRLSDGPDDIRTAEIGRLDRGDEVEVIGEHDGFLQVRTSTGLEGWIPRVVIVG